MADQKIVLAYSGGLDTSCILKYLQEKGYQVVAFIADLGQEDDMSVLERRAHEQGAVAVHVVDLRRAFVTEFVLPAIAGNALYENRYLLGTSLARPLIARGQVEVALAEGAGWVSHGATGKGNDQVRFELAYAALAPQLRVFAPWKDAEFLARFKGRTDMLRYAEQHGLKLDVTVDKPWSDRREPDAQELRGGPARGPGLGAARRDVHSHPLAARGAGPAGRSRAPLRVVAAGRRSSFPPRAAASPIRSSSSSSSTGSAASTPSAASTWWRTDSSASSRAASTRPRAAPSCSRRCAISRAWRWIARCCACATCSRSSFAQLIYNGFWFSPEMDVVRAAFAQAERGVDGRVALRLYKGNVIGRGRQSPQKLYDQTLSSMDVAGGYDQTDARGFIRLNALRLRAYRRIEDKSAGAGGARSEVVGATAGARSK